VNSLRYLAFPLFSSLLLVIYIISLLVGSVKLPQDKLLLHLFGFQRDSALLSAVLELRVTRSLTAVVSGVSLGVAGCLLQSLFRNPMADPYILGISSGSSLAIAVTLVLGIGFGLINGYDPYALYMAGALGAAAVSLLVIILSTIVRTHVSLILVGIMLGYLNAGLTTLIIYTSDIEVVRAFSFWTLGTFAAAKWSLLEATLPFVLVGLVAAFLLAKPLNALVFGEEQALSLGVWIRGVRVAVVAVTSFIVSAVTVLSGSIGFIGLAAPHLAKLVSETIDNRVIIPLAALGGSTLALVADIVARNLMPPLDLPVTAVTSLFGALLIIMLLMRGYRRL